MTAEPTYEYRVVAHHCRRQNLLALFGALKCRQWIAQRRLVTPWEDVPEGATDDQ